MNWLKNNKIIPLL